jgi:hypothetical protein
MAPAKVSAMTEASAGAGGLPADHPANDLTKIFVKILTTSGKRHGQDLHFHTKARRFA